MALRLRPAFFTALSVALVCVLVSLAGAPPASAQGSGSSHSIVKRINSIRRAHGLAALKVSYSLKRSARRYAGRMLRRSYFGHLSRIQASRRFGYLGEVLARSPRVPRAASVVSAWMNSPSHRAVLMNRRYRYVGIGRAHGRTLGSVVVGHFGAR